MSLTSLIIRKAPRALALGLVLWLVTTLLVAVPVKAGGLALSGSFYRQDFVMPVGSTLSSPDVNVIVFNNGDTDFSIKMSSETPPGVKLFFSENDFELKAADQKTVEISIEVGQEVIPGDYELEITAEAYTGGEGIQLMGAAGQTAKLTITGESALVEIATVSPDGEPIPAVIRLFRQINSDTFDVGYSENGTLKTRVAPGNYVTSAYVAEKKLAEESFSVSAGEEKTILLELKTVFFEGFSIVPFNDKNTGKLAMAQVVYAVNNLYAAFAQAEVVLNVSHDGTPLDETVLVNLTPLEKGKIELSYNYIPAEGWQPGIYRFQLKLMIDGEPYIVSAEKELENIGPSPLTTTPPPGGKFNWSLAGGIAGGAVLVVIAAVIAVMILRKRVKPESQL